MRGSAVARLVVAILLVALPAAILSPGPALGAASLNDAEAELCRLINEFRAENGLPPLKVSTDLNEASDWHAQDMASMDYFSHTDSLGRDPFTRMDYFGYDYATTRGENIAAGSSGAAATLEQWKSSPPHRANLLTSGYRVMGLAKSSSSTSTYTHYWNNTFGGYVDAGAEQCPGSPTSPPPSPSPSPTDGTSAVSVDDASALEGTSRNGRLEFTVSLSQAPTAEIKVGFRTQDGTASGVSDYRSKSGTLRFAAGQTRQVVAVIALKDGTPEPDETFTLELTTSTGGYTIGDGRGSGTIRNDD